MKKTFKLTPELTCPELAGYALPSFPRHQRDDVEKKYSEELDKRAAIAKNYKGQVAGRHPDSFTREEMKGMIRGYMESRDKYEFTRADMMRAIDLSQEVHKPKYSPECEYEHTYTPEQVLLILRTPIAIEVEMEQVKVNLMGRIVDPMDVTQNQSACKWLERPATNPDGTLKGRWVYE